MSEEPSQEKLIAEIFKLQRAPENQDGNRFTNKEVAVILEVSDETSRKFIKKCINEGLAKFAGRREEIMIDGRRGKVPTYEFSDPESLKSEDVDSQ